MSTIGNAQIAALKSEAANVGDTKMVRICDRALDGSKRAIAQVRRVLVDAAAQQ